MSYYYFFYLNYFSYVDILHSHDNNTLLNNQGSQILQHDYIFYNVPACMSSR